MKDAPHGMYSGSIIRRLRTTPAPSRSPKDTARITGHFHDLELTIQERPLHAGGKPKADGSRALRQMRHAATGVVARKPGAIDTMREQAGCFVLITNVPVEGPPGSDIPYDGRLRLFL